MHLLVLALLLYRLASTGWAWFPLLIFMLAAVSAAYQIRLALASARSRHPAAAVSANGVDTLLPAGRMERVAWEDLRYIDAVDAQTGRLRKTAYLSARGPEGETRSLPLLLQNRGRAETRAFQAALRYYWPDFDQPWQAQLERRGAD
ncbi:hypothetical protein ACUXV3_00515 [Roseobacteraceae bacterium NS-SX3]